MDGIAQGNGARADERGVGGWVWAILKVDSTREIGFFIVQKAIYQMSPNPLNDYKCPKKVRCHDLILLLSN